MYFVWPLVFGLNMVVPIMFSVSLTRQAGQYGILAGAVLLLLLGWGLCYHLPVYAWRLNLGSVVVACTQFFPILQIVIGIISLPLARRMTGLKPRELSFDGLPELTSELEGFFATLLVGSALIGISGVLGFLIALVLAHVARTKVRTGT